MKNDLRLMLLLVGVSGLACAAMVRLVFDSHWESAVKIETKIAEIDARLDVIRRTQVQQGTDISLTHDLALAQLKAMIEESKRAALFPTQRP